MEYLINFYSKKNKEVELVVSFKELKQLVKMTAHKLLNLIPLLIFQKKRKRDI